MLDRQYVGTTGQTRYRRGGSSVINHTKAFEKLHQRENWPRCFDGSFLWYRHSKNTGGSKMATYRVVLNGVLKGLEASQVAPQLALVCKIPVEGAKALLANPGTVLKGALDLEMANAYRATLRGVGCQVLLEEEADAPKRSLLSRLTGRSNRTGANVPDARQYAGALGQRAKSALKALTIPAQRYLARAGQRVNPANATAGKPLSPVMAHWQRAASWLSARISKGAPRLVAMPRAKRFLSVNTLVIASVAVTAVAIAGVFTGSRSSPDGPCPTGFQATSSGTCAGEVSFSNGEKYVGELKDGQPNGHGTFIWPNGDKYVGEWKEGQRNGMGRFFWSDGTKYVGEFRNNKKHGMGTYTYANGRTTTGKWKDGNPVQEPMVTVQKPVAGK